MMLLIGAYLGAIVAANLLVAEFGPAMSIWNAFIFIGLDLTARDRLHDRWARNQLAVRMGALIAVGGGLSWLLNRDAGVIAVASVVAFTAASAVDALAYYRWRHRPWMERANGSNILGAAVDSVIFPTIAFGGWIAWVTLGQFAAKVAGGLIWSFVLGERFYRCAECGRTDRLHEMSCSVAA